MLKPPLRKTTALFLLLLLLGSPVHGKKLYRWYDEEGNIFFSDKVPPQHSIYQRDSLNNQGRVIQTIEAPKSVEELELEKRLEALRQEQEKIITKQQSHDKVLLSTFRSEEDMRLSLDRKLLAIGSREKAAEGNLIRLENQLKGQIKDAAEHERNGRKVPPDLLAKIEASKIQIGQAKANVAVHVQSREDAVKSFQADLERFRFLNHTQQSDKAEADNSAEIKAGNLLGLYSCRDDQQCATAWRLAKAYVEKHSTMPIEQETDDLIMTESPYSDQDISLSVSKIKKKEEKVQIFLDIRCKKNSLGDALCASAKINGIRTSFRPYIAAHLSSVPTP
ncbi:MAG: DUF4124 domain-containing protein [Gammaproteobacteria bacterium]